DPVTLKNDFEGYRIYRSTDPFFLDAKVISNARGTGPIGHGRPIAQFDLKNGITGFSGQTVEGVAYYLGDDSGITHTWVDSTVTNGQLYYYAITAYDHGSDSLEFYPSENAITISRTPRGGTILPQNAVEVRPNPKVLGYIPATTSSLVRRSGIGTGTIEMKVVNSSHVPDSHTMLLAFKTDREENVRADFYELIDSTSGTTLIGRGSSFDGEEIGQVGGGLLPIIDTPGNVLFNDSLSRFTLPGVTNTRLKITYQEVLPINQRRPGFPDNLTITFSDVPLDTSLPAVGRPARPVRFRIVANTDSGALRLKTQFRELDDDGTLSHPDEFFDIVTYSPASPATPRATWRVELDTTGQYLRGTIVPPTLGDVFEAIIDKPFGDGDTFAFT
ncbi:MAG: hypothetical protein WD295_01795, partial [Bacteroidota bacterium]